MDGCNSDLRESVVAQLGLHGGHCDCHQKEQQHFHESCCQLHFHMDPWQTLGGRFSTEISWVNDTSLDPNARSLLLLHNVAVMVNTAGEVQSSLKGNRV